MKSAESDYKAQYYVYRVQLTLMGPAFRNYEAQIYSNKFVAIHSVTAAILYRRLSGCS